MQLIYDNAHRDTRKQHKLLQLFFLLWNVYIIITYLLQFYDKCTQRQTQKETISCFTIDIQHTDYTHRDTHTHVQTHKQKAIR